MHFLQAEHNNINLDFETLFWQSLSRAIHLLAEEAIFSVSLDSRALSYIKL
jgi:hypothetical protein